MIDNRTFTAEEMRTAIAHALAKYAQYHNQNWNDLVAEGGIELLDDPCEFEVCTKAAQRFIVSVRADQAAGRPAEDGER